MLNWKSLAFGLLLAVVLYFMFLSFGLTTFSILSFILAPLIAGYIVGGDTKTAAIQGAIIGFFGSMIATLTFAALISYFNNIQIALELNLIAILFILVFYALMGVVFSIIGAIIKNRAMKE